MNTPHPPPLTIISPPLNLDIASQNTAAFPINAFPSLLKNVIESLHTDTQIPIELISQVVLAAASLACQSIINVQPHYSQTPEPCSLYFLTLAEPGEGKTTINKYIMKPFYEFSAMLKEEYIQKCEDYDQSLTIWKLEKQVFEANLKQAIKKGYSGELQREQLTHHLEKKPKKPPFYQFIYEDVTNKALIEGLRKNPEAGIISDEAIIFFNGYLKKHLGILNKAWDGEVYTFNRANEETFDIQPCLTLSLMTQPNVFTEYLKKHISIAKGSGFLSRFLFTSISTNQGKRFYSPDNALSERSLTALNEFYEKITSLLNQKKEISQNGQPNKETIKLNDEAINTWAQTKNQMEKYRDKNQEWSHISDIISKSGSNTIRLAAIFKKFSNNTTDNYLNSDDINNAYKIIYWNSLQASELFFPFSEVHSKIRDARELFLWIKHRYSNNNSPFLKNDILKYGPRKFRKIEYLDYILNIIINQTNIRIIRSGQTGALYITILMQNGHFAIPYLLNSTPQAGSYYVHYNMLPINTNIQFPPIDFSDL
ncbi:YfjI family protein [Providencia stuartii]|uniref:YfjI family protein n=1 Tax=Providencia stuartii TaxID=588 RepID=UPI0034E5643A